MVYFLFRFGDLPVFSDFECLFRNFVMQSCKISSAVLHKLTGNANDSFTQSLAKITWLSVKLSAFSHLQLL